MNPRLIRRIVFGYTVDSFPGMLILGQHQLKRKIERAGFDILVTFLPLDDLPSDTDILFVLPALEQMARRAVPDSIVYVVEDFVNNPEYDQVIEKLLVGTDWTAKQLSDRPPEDEGGEIVRYRGYERLE